MKIGPNKYRKLCKRENYVGNAHELTFSCYRNQPFLRSERACNFLVTAINKARSKHNFSLWAYVFMPTHVHLLIAPPEANYLVKSTDSGGTAKQSLGVFSSEYNSSLAKNKIIQTNFSVSDILASIKQSVSRKALNYLRQENPAGLKQLATGQTDSPYRFWQDGGGYDRNITKVETLIKTVSYIHANPVRKGLAELPDQWYYSSAAEWQKPGSGPLIIDFDTWPVT